VFKGQCQHCGSTETVGLSSIDKRICNVCKKLSPWKLKAGQKAPLQDKKVGDPKTMDYV